jgi:hypothetical protein
MSHMRRHWLRRWFSSKDGAMNDYNPTKEVRILLKKLTCLQLR